MKSLRFLGIALTLPAALAAEPIEDRASFAISLRGLAAATLTFSGAQDGNSYRVAGQLQSNGIVAIVRRVRYDAEATGRVRGGRYKPESYREATDTGSRQSQAVIAYRGGVPQVKSYSPAPPSEPGDLDPATQGGTIDPLTAVYATLRDVDRAGACSLTLQVFDGRRRSQLTLSDPRPDGAGLACSGEYRRIAGFSDDDMRKKSRFPFTVTYAAADTGRLRVVGIEADTLFGRAVMRRQ